MLTTAQRKIIWKRLKIILEFESESGTKFFKKSQISIATVNLSLQSHQLVSCFYEGFYSQALVVVRRNCGCWLFLHRRVAAPSVSLRAVAKILQYLAPSSLLTPLSYNNTFPRHLKSTLAWGKSFERKNQDLLLIMFGCQCPQRRSEDEGIWLVAVAPSKAGVANNSNSMHEIQRARARKYNRVPETEIQMQFWKKSVHFSKRSCCVDWTMTARSRRNDLWFGGRRIW